MDIVNLIMVHLFGANVGVATIFGYPNDKWAGGEAICIKRMINDKDIGIASRDLPCGAKVKLYNIRTNKLIVARVMDKGPFGAIYKGKWVLKRRAKDPGVYRGFVDLTPRAAKLLGHNGYEPIILKAL